MSLLEIAAVIISFLGIWLTAKRHLLCWPVGLVGCALYFKLFLDVRLYADMGLQALFIAATLYGWYEWAGGKKNDAGEVAVASLSFQRAAVSLAAGVAGALAIGWFTSHYTNAALPWMDSSLSSFSLVATYWTAQRYPSNWLLWIVIDVIYVGMFIFKGLHLTAGLYAAMTGLAVLGYARWVKAARELQPA